MPLVFVTGISGAGKSAVRDALRERGFEAYGTDEDDIARWVDKETGETFPAAIPSSQRTMEFMRTHDWRMALDVVHSLAARSVDRSTFICGAARNEAEFWELFDAVILLTIDEATLRARIAARKENDFGKSDHELALILGWMRYLEDDYRSHGAITVDATRTLSEVVEDVLKVAESRRTE